MSPPDKDQPPSLPTAVGKVRDNETLSQPFRTQPRHRVSKDREVLIVPVTQPTNIQSNNFNNNNNNNIVNNNNISTETDSNPVRKSSNRSSVLPPKEPAQEEVNRAFQEQLSKAKLKLRSSGGVPTDFVGPSEDGAPPPPPPPVLPNPPPGRTAQPQILPGNGPQPPRAPVLPNPSLGRAGQPQLLPGTVPQPPSAPKWEKRVSTLPKGPIVNPRDELMAAIRASAGRPGGRLAATS